MDKIVYVVALFQDSVTNHITQSYLYPKHELRPILHINFVASERCTCAHTWLQLMLWFRGNSIHRGLKLVLYAPSQDGGTSTLVIPLTTTTLLDASRTWTTGWEYRGSILTAVCCLEVVAPPISKGMLMPVLSISLKVS